LRNDENAFQIEDGVLHINKQKIMAGSARQPRASGLRTIRSDRPSTAWPACILALRG
jgi:hypothetical protein